MKIEIPQARFFHQEEEVQKVVTKGYGPSLEFPRSIRESNNLIGAFMNINEYLKSNPKGFVDMEVYLRDGSFVSIESITCGYEVILVF